MADNSKNGPSIAFAFVCQSGDLEAEACLLAISLRQYMSFPPGSLLVAYVPGPESVTGTLHHTTCELLNQLDVRVVHSDNAHLMSRTPLREVDFMTNKFCCIEAAASFGTERLVFLDSDQFCHAPLDWPLNWPTVTACRVGTTGATEVAGLWEQAYSCCDIKMPTDRYALADGDGKSLITPPAFNGGLIILRTTVALEFVSEWRRCFYNLDQSSLEFGPDNFYMEQTALPIATIAVGADYLIADPEQFDRSILHYHHPKHLLPRPHFLRLIAEFVADQPLIETILDRDERWSGVLNEIRCQYGSAAEILAAENAIARPCQYPLRLTDDFLQVDILELGDREFSDPVFHDSAGLLSQRVKPERINVSAVTVTPTFRSIDCSRVDAIVHTAFCGSTLLANYIQTLGCATLYREPQVLTQLAVQKWQAYSRISRERWADIFEMSLRLMARRAATGVVAGVKLHDSGTNLCSELLDRHCEARIILLYSDLKQFLIANLKELHRRNWIRTRVACCGGQTDVLLKDVKTSTLTDAQVCAYVWLAQMKTCREALRRHPIRMLSVESELLFSQPVDVLRQVCSFLKYHVDEESIERSVRTHRRIHAKTRRPMDWENQKSAARRLHLKYEREIRDGLHWAQEICGAEGIPTGQPNALQLGSQPMSVNVSAHHS